MSNKNTKKIKLNYIHIYSFLIPFILSITCLAISGFQPFGSKDIFTATNNEATLTNYYRLHDYIHGVYSSENLKEIWALYMTNPINLITLAFPREMVIGVLSIIYTFNLGVAGLSFSLYLKNKYKDSNNFIILLISIAYALSGYMLVYGANVSFLSVVAIFPLIIMELDALISSGKWFNYYIALFIASIFSIYSCLVVLVFSVLYLIIQDYKNLKHFFKTILYKALSETLALGSVSFILLTLFNGNITRSFFFKNVPAQTFITSFFDSFRRFLTLSEPSASTNTDYGIDLYLGILCLLLVFIYVVHPKYDIFMKLRKGAIIAFLFLGTICTTPNTILNVLAKNEYNSCFFAFGLVFLLLITAFDVLSEIESINKLTILIASSSLIVLTILSLFFSHTYKSSSPFIYTLEVCILFTMILIILNIKKEYQKKIIPILCILGIFEIAITYGAGTLSLSNRPATYSSSYSANLYEAEKKMRSNNENINVIEYNLFNDYFNPIFNTINNVNYVLCQKGLDKPDACLEYVESIGNVDIYKNTASLNGYIFAPFNLKNWTYSDTSSYMSSEYLYNMITGNGTSLFNKIEYVMNFSGTSITDESGNVNTEVSAAYFELGFSYSGDIYSSYIRDNYIGNTSVANPIPKTYTLPTYYSHDYRSYTDYFYSFDKATYEESLENLKVLTPESSSFSNDADGYLILSIGSKPTKSISLDGETTYPICVDDSLWIIPVKAGSHTVSIDTPDELINNIYYLIFISFIFVLISIILMIYQSKLVSLKQSLKKPYRLLKENYVYIATILISLGVFLFAAFMDSCEPFGRISVLGSDGYVQTYPAMASMIKGLSIKNLIPAKSTIGYSTFIFSVGADYITSYISTVISLIYRALIWTNDGKLYTAILFLFYFLYPGPSLIFYLTHRYSGKRFDKSNPYLILIALFYNLSNYFIGYYTYNNFSYGLYVPLIILALEKMVYKKKPLAYILFLSFVMIRGYYSAFLICEFLGLFFLTLEYSNKKDFIIKGVRFLISSILAACIGAFNLLPAFIGTQTSGYKTNDTAAVSSGAGISLTSSILKSLNQYQAAQNAVVMNADDQMVNIYAGLIPLLFIAVYLCNNKINKSVRIRKALVCLILFYAFGNTALNYVFHGFHFQSNVPNRFSAFFIFMIIMMFADTLQNLNSLSKKRIFIPILSSSILIILLWSIYPVKNMLSFCISCILIISYVISTLYFYKKNIDTHIYTKLIAYISVIELVFCSTITCSTAIGHMNPVLENNIKSIGILTKDINNSTDSDLFITENITNSLDNFNMGLVNNLNTISGFSSGLSTKASDMAFYWGIMVSNNNIKYGTGNPLADMMLHVKYHIIDSDNSEYSKSTIYTPVASHNNMVLYENPYYLPIAFMTSEELMNWSCLLPESCTSLMDYQNRFAKAVCGKDLYTQIETPTENTEDSYLISSVSDTNMYGTNDLNVQLRLDSSFNGKIYAFYGDRCSFVGDSDKVQDNTFNFVLHEFISDGEVYDENIIFAVLNEDVLTEMHNIFNSSAITNLEKASDHISGNIDVKEDGILYISVPNYSNMDILVDGKKTTHYEYLHGTGINLTKGNHTIRIEGTTDNYLNGVIISLVSVLLMLLFLFINNRISKVLDKQDVSSSVTDDNSSKKISNQQKNKTNKITKNSKDKDLDLLPNETSNDTTMKKSIINKTYLASFVLPFIVVMLSMAYSGFAPFGPRDVITANDQSFMTKYIYEFYDRIHNGAGIFTYSLNEGTGYDFTTVLTYYLSDPTLLLILLFPRTAIFTVLNMLYIIKLALGSSFMSVYLSKSNIHLFKSNKATAPQEKENYVEDDENTNKKNDLIIGGSEEAPNIIQKITNSINIPIVAFSLMYALSNYMLGPGFNTTMQGAVTIFPLLMLGLDKLIYEKKKKLYIITYILSFFLNFKISIISSIFMILYLIVPKYDNLKSFIKTIGRKLLCDILIFLSSAVIILNNVFSSFWQQDITAPEKTDSFISIFDIIKMMTTGIKPANILLAGNNIYLYCGIIALYSVLLLAFNSKIIFNVRIRYLILYVILFLGFSITTLNTILNGFIYYDGISSTYSYTIIFLSIFITYVEYKYITEYKNKNINIVLPTIITSSLLIAAIFLCESYDTPSIFIKSLEFVFFYFIILIIYNNKSMTKWLTKLMISLILIIELIISFPAGMKMLSWYTYPYKILPAAINENAITHIRETDPDSSILVIDSMRSSHTPLEVALMGYDYVIWSGSEDPYNTLELYEEYNGANIYKVTHNAHCYNLDESAAAFTYDKYSPIDSINDFSTMVLKSDESLPKVDYAEVGGNYANNTNIINIEHSDSGDLFYNYSYISNVNNTNENETTTFTQAVNKQRHKYIKGLYKLSIDNYNNSLSSIEQYNPDKIYNSTFDITSKNPGYLTIGLYNRPGWNITVNNSKVEPKVFLNDGMMIPILEGTNNISIYYRPIMYYIGLNISLISILIVIIYTYIKASTKKKSDKRSNPKE